MSDPRAEWIGWALDVLRRYAPDPVIDRDDELAELDALLTDPFEVELCPMGQCPAAGCTCEFRDDERFFLDEQSPSERNFR